ncbi:CELR3-like protein [Mya arenaria]|uniref:CELR3-like protein n=1 Tax=Mya arenaria TaxID=6604 RepID=A0ABY7EP76_MYAAR|nr:CELR3-like protein [Mya arenaria]
MDMIGEFAVRATDNGSPGRSTDGSVTIQITRAVLPRFLNTPYSTSVQENSVNGTCIFTVSATDADGQTPGQRATADVTIGVQHNVNSPIFKPDNYIEVIPEETAVGASILRVTATDADKTALYRWHPTIVYRLDGFVPAVDNRLQQSQVLRSSVVVIRATDADITSPENLIISSATVNIVVIRNNNAPVFTSFERYDVTINEVVPVLQEVLTVTAHDVDNGLVRYNMIDSPASSVFRIEFVTGQIFPLVSLLEVSEDIYQHQIMYSIIASTSRTFFSNINPTNGEIRVNGDLSQTGVSVFEITIHARDNPGSNAVSRFDMATVSVTITVTRPVFTSATYNATISEYFPVQQSVIRTVATDADQANTPSGTIDYSIEYISSTLTNGFAQFLVSPTDGSICISQPLTRINVPGNFELHVVATDLRPCSQSQLQRQCTSPSSATSMLQSLPTKRDTPDYWAFGRDLFQATAIDDDPDVVLSRNTHNAEFDYLIDPDELYAAQFFGINKDGILFVKANIQEADKREEFKTVEVGSEHARHKDVSKMPAV